ncbi:cytoskeleton assembly control protein [Rhodopirellula sp. JC740]|uniref:Cytoskeleton assembly control protein n=1 Tax=Rhodopirellula halodulae TaxID=2894198 RepID=A0ABS8NKM0_9BACT|nr:SHD1 domain-containing protein [Rhodopirellula sp. JC740]MCC9643031.1 cytoskeleton assembly control protein [Rhodopirellula sp. JC740]
MNRSLRLTLQWTLVVCMIAILSVSPASAGWLLKRIHGNNAASCEIASDTCCPAPQPVCCEPVACEPVCCEPAPAPTCCDSAEIIPAPVVAPMVTDCCGGGVVGEVIVEQPLMGETILSETPVEGGIIEAPAIVSEKPADEETDTAPPMPAETEEPAVAPEADPAANAEPTEAEAPVEAPAQEAPVVDEPVMEEPAVEAPAEEEPTVEEPVMEEPAVEEPLTETPEANPFPTEAPAEEAPFDMPVEEAPVEAEPADDGFGDLFGGDTEMPAEPATPDVEAPAADPIDDLFGGNDAAPADMPAEQPADDGFGDLFGGDTDPAPAEMPADQPADDGFGDLFGGESEAPADALMPAEEAAPAEDGLNDLFNEGGNDAAPADGGLDDLFGDPPADNNADTDLDDLFGKAEPRLADSEVTQVVTEKKAADSIDVLESTKTRTWIDNTGNWGTDGRLVEVRPNEIKILKTNGKTCTVPMERLSDADQSYVESIRAQVNELLFAMASAK